MDYDKCSAADNLGKLKMHSWQFDNEQGYQGPPLKLKDCGKGRTATLTVAVQVLPPTPEATPLSELGSRLRVKCILPEVSEQQTGAGNQTLSACFRSGGVQILNSKLGTLLRHWNQCGMRST